MHATLLPAFQNPVLDSQRVFRHILTALSEPGLWREVRPVVNTAPSPLPPVMGSLLLTLCDRETTLWLSPSLRNDEVLAWLRFHLACPVVENPGQATFAAIMPPDDMPPLTEFAQGSTEYPDRSTTIILHNASCAEQWKVRGPGIPDERNFSSVLPSSFLPQWQENGCAFPCGVDLLLTSATALAGLPRTTRLEAICM